MGIHLATNLPGIAMHAIACARGSGSVAAIATMPPFVLPLTLTAWLAMLRYEVGAFGGHGVGDSIMAGRRTDKRGQARGNRQGDVFPIRMTASERLEFSQYVSEYDGPTSLWIRGGVSTREPLSSGIIRTSLPLRVDAHNPDATPFDRF